MSNQKALARKSTLTNTEAQENQFEGRGFTVQKKSDTHTQKSDLNTLLLQAKTFGHSISKLAGQESSSASPQTNGLSIQHKLSIGEPGDRYEQEADRVASVVVQRINAPSSTGESVQREPMPEEEDELQMKLLADSIQRLEDDEEELQMKSLADSIQRVEIDDEEELQMKSQVQRQEAIGGGEASTDLESSINSARGSGQAIADNIREPMEVAFGADFSGVKVHTDGQSDQLNRSIQARAFTTGQDVFFRSGEYNPGSRGGQELLAHELTHVVQQNGAAVQRTHTKNKSEDSLSQKSVQRKIATQSLTSFPIQRLLYKTDNTNVDIDTLSFARVLDYLKRPDPDLDPGGVIFEPGDKARLSAKADELYVLEFNKLHTFLGTEPVSNEKTKRNLPTTLDLPKLLTDMQTRYTEGDLPGFREWLAGTNVNLRTENVLDKINELRFAQDIVGAVNVDETAIANTKQTADLTHADSQTEVKTIRKPIQGYTDFTGQVTAALGKFANVNPADGKTYNAAIYASIDENLIAGKTTTKNGTVTNTKIDPTTLDKVTTLTRQSDGEMLREMKDNQLDKLLHNLNEQSWAGANRTHNIYIFLENGAPQQLIRNQATKQWAKA